MVFNDLDAGVGEFDVRPLSMLLSPIVAGGDLDLAGDSTLLELPAGLAKAALGAAAEERGVLLSSEAEVEVPSDGASVSEIMVHGDSEGDGSEEIRE